MKNYFLYPVKNDALVYGYEISKFTQANVDNVFTHKHEFYEIYLLLRGRVKYSYNASVNNIADNTLIIIPPNTPHYAVINPDGNIYYRYILWIKSSLLQEISKKDHIVIYDKPQMKKLSAINSGVVAGIMDLLLTEQNQYDDGTIKPNKKFTRGLISNLFLYISACKKSDSSSSSEFLQQTHKIIQKNLSEPFDLEKISSEIFLSKYHLARKFKQETGLTLLQYVTQQKLVYAKHLLKEGYNASETALKCGYVDYSSFYRAFLREFGLCPQKYLSSFIKK